MATAVRKVDLYVMGAFNFGSSARQRTSPSLVVEKGGQVCAGAVKLAQRMLITMMAYNVYYDPTWGTTLLRIVSSCAPQAIMPYLQQSMALIINNTVSQLQAQETDDMPADEKIDHAYMDDAAYDRGLGKLSLSIILVSQSKENIPLTVPISVVP
jgi:hypothetical protein